MNKMSYTSRKRQDLRLVNIEKSKEKGCGKIKKEEDHIEN